ncbi:glycosyl transferase family 2 [Sporocytophaga myxococcoides]|uniref:Glycosyl transferase family 2 n=1 Tax=Sporocytophaga myxococcoides TaxID=153721 RepID=A0A098LA53_9BACT|nr:glycosyltransferase family 2 protein [Sporocytophaga myxococcoides]GAL83786.1 glycosyl transferase family 2 [Sporocytophaga myxococcoides]
MKELVSVILPVYNSEKYVKEAIQSILNQTYRCLELIIIDDYSTDKSLQVIESIEDSRIKIIRNSRNVGRAGCDNLGLVFANGRYIAKMDSDDIAHPMRLSKQIEFLFQNKNVNTVGCFMQNFGYSNYLNKYPATVQENKAYTLFGLPCGNPSLTFKREVFDGGHKYNEHLRQTEDYDFFARYYDVLNVCNIQEPLMFYRTYPEDKRKEILSDRFETAMRVRKEFLLSIGLPFDKEELQIHHCLYHYQLPANNIYLQNVEKWLKKLESFNNQKLIFDPKALTSVLARKYFEFCYLHTFPYLKSFRAFQHSDYSRILNPELSLKIKFIMKGVMNFNKYNQ